MKRVLAVALIVLTAILAAYFLNEYWTHRYDALIEQQAAIYRVDPDLVWSIIYEETYFSPWKLGKDGEVGLMQVTPTVGREWATETGMREFERQMTSDPKTFRETRNITSKLDVGISKNFASNSTEIQTRKRAWWLDIMPGQAAQSNGTRLDKTESR